MEDTMISLNIRFSPEFDKTVQKLNNEGRKTSKVSIIKELVNEFRKTLPHAESFMKPLRELDKNVTIEVDYQIG